MAAVVAGRRARLAMYSECASAVQNTPSSSDQQQRVRRHRAARAAFGEHERRDAQRRHARSARAPSPTTGLRAQLARAHGQQREHEAGQHAPRKAAHRVARPAELGHEQQEAGDDQRDLGQLAPAQRDPEHRALEQRHEHREARVSEQADRDRRLLDGREERDPVDGEDHAVGQRAGRAATPGAPAGTGRRTASTTAATAVRPSTIATGSHGIHLPKRPAKPNSATLEVERAQALRRTRNAAARAGSACAHHAIGSQRLR